MGYTPPPCHFGSFVAERVRGDGMRGYATSVVFDVVRETRRRLEAVDG